MFGDETGFLCVYVGRISNEKRLDIVIDVMRRLTCDLWLTARAA